MHCRDQVPAVGANVHLRKKIIFAVGKATGPVSLRTLGKDRKHTVTSTKCSPLCVVLSHSAGA